MQDLNWPKLRNAIKRRLRYMVEPQDLADAVQEACGFAWIMIDDGTDPGLAVWKSVQRVLRGHTLTYDPAARERWEDSDYAGTLFYLKSRPGVSEYSARISAGGSHLSREEQLALAEK